MEMKIMSKIFDNRINSMYLYVESTFGEYLEFAYKIINNNAEEEAEGHGIFSKQGIFEKCAYDSNYDLKPEDNSSRFASTEWVNKIMPIGAIIMFGGTSSKIPEGWHICDGTNGTPNLIGRFIKATGSD